ncbi:MAG: ammonium transporter [Bacteroidales bacterium]
MLDINNGDVAFMVITTVLVFFMTPGLAFFYGGLMEKKDSLTMMFYSFMAVGIVTVMWVLGGFSMVFGSDIGGIIGDPTQYFMLQHMDFSINPNYGSKIPFLMFFMYQLMFAIIVAPLMTGAFAGRMSPGNWIKMLVLWMLLIYFPVAHWVWGGGFLSQLGFVDYAGGTVIHVTAGFSSLMAILFLGKRLEIPKRNYGNMNLVLIGFAILLFGWFGFNSGGALDSGEKAAIAFTNTGIAAGFSTVVWMIIAYCFQHKFSMVELATGAVAGLATITPAAGYVSPQFSALIGIIAAIVCYFCVQGLKYCKVDDALGVWGVHGMGGFTGTLLIGLFADPMINGVSLGGKQFLIQLVGVVFVVIYSMFCTWIILKLISLTSSLKVSDKIQKEGLDQAYMKENDHIQ